MESQNVTETTKTPLGQGVTPRDGGRRGAVVTVIDRKTVTAENISEIRGLVVYELQDHVKAGDVISIICFANVSEQNKGIITIWHNHRKAALSRGYGSVFGTWDENHHIIVTGITDDAWTTAGEEIMGKIAYDLYGKEGIFSCGEFYRWNCELLLKTGELS